MFSQGNIQRPLHDRGADSVEEGDQEGVRGRWTQTAMQWTTTASARIAESAAGHVKKTQHYLFLTTISRSSPHTLIPFSVCLGQFNVKVLSNWKASKGGYIA